MFLKVAVSYGAYNVCIRKSARCAVTRIDHGIILPCSKSFKRFDKIIGISAGKIVSSVSRSKKRVAANELISTVITYRTGSVTGSGYDLNVFSAERENVTPIQ